MSGDAKGNADCSRRKPNSALNAHDIEAFVACFDDGYNSEQPAHPDRAFDGRKQVRQNWWAIFGGAPASLLRVAVSGDTKWSECHRRGTHADGASIVIVESSSAGSATAA